MAYAYDNENIFARILRGEIPCDKVLETDHALAFRDIAPKTPDHVLVIPKGAYVTWDHFAAEASDAEVADFVRAVGKVAQMVDAAPGDGKNGYRLISNAGTDGVQEVPHLHLHVLAGRPLGWMIRPG